jgi:hypothetical protein
MAQRLGPSPLDARIQDCGLISGRGLTLLCVNSASRRDTPPSLQEFLIRRKRPRGAFRKPLTQETRGHRAAIEIGGGYHSN